MLLCNIFIGVRRPAPRPCWLSVDVCVIVSYIWAEEMIVSAPKCTVVFLVFCFWNELRLTDPSPTSSTARSLGDTLACACFQRVVREGVRLPCIHFISYREFWRFFGFYHTQYERNHAGASPRKLHHAPPCRTSPVNITMSPKSKWTLWMVPVNLVILMSLPLGEKLHKTESGTPSYQWSFINSCSFAGSKSKWIFCFRHPGADTNRVFSLNWCGFATSPSRSTRCCCCILSNQCSVNSLIPDRYITCNYILS